MSERAGVVTGTVSRSNTNTALPLTVNVLSSDTSAATVAATVTILSGQMSTTFAIAGVDDDLLDGLQTATISVSATGYASASADVTVSDYESLAITFDKTSISERLGTARGRVTRSNTDVTSDLVVELTNSDPSELAIPTQITIKTGSRFVEFDIAAADDTWLDGTQVVLVSAAAAGYAGSNVSVNVTDFETATLSIDQTSMSEKNGLVRGTITRNNTDTTSEVIFTITGSDITEAKVPASVTIPAGQSSASFDIESADDGFLDGDQVVNITASSPLYPEVTVR